MKGELSKVGEQGFQQEPHDLHFTAAWSCLVHEIMSTQACNRKQGALSKISTQRGAPLSLSSSWAPVASSPKSESCRRPLVKLNTLSSKMWAFPVAQW